VLCGERKTPKVFGGALDSLVPVLLRHMKSKDMETKVDQKYVDELEDDQSIKHGQGCWVWKKHAEPVRGQGVLCQ